MQPYYEINVSHNGRHLFATAPRSAIDFREAKELHKALQEKFPKNEGYELTCTHWKVEGTTAHF